MSDPDFWLASITSGGREPTGDDAIALRKILFQGRRAGNWIRNDCSARGNYIFREMKILAGVNTIIINTVPKSQLSVRRPLTVSICASESMPIAKPLTTIILFLTISGIKFSRSPAGRNACICARRPRPVFFLRWFLTLLYKIIKRWIKISFSNPDNPLLRWK